MIAKKWTFDDLMTMRRHIANGLKDKEIARIMSRSHRSIQQQRLKTTNHSECGLRELFRESRKMSPNEYASRWHLVDLKRAGHSPRFTEKPVGADLMCPVRMAAPLHSMSLIGSSAAMCADNAGRGY